MAARTLRSDAFDSITRILAAARSVFALGDGSGTLGRIAQEAGVGIATVYRHFPNREALAVAVYDDLFTTEITPMLAEFERTDAPREILLDMAERLLDVLDRQRGLTQSLGNISQVTVDLMNRKLDVIAPTITRAQKLGNLRLDIAPADVPNLIAMVTSGLLGTNLDRLLRRRYLSLLLDGLNPDHAQPLPG